MEKVLLLGLYQSRRLFSSLKVEMNIFSVLGLSTDEDSEQLD